MISFRLATEEDAPLLLSWRNDATTRTNSRYSDAVPVDRHLKWLRETLSCSKTKLLVAEDRGRPIGTVRADCREGYIELSWTVAPRDRGRGIGTQMLANSLRAISERPLRAMIKPENVASIRMAKACGFAFLEVIDELEIYEIR
jgi:RimJ/RimL family protein N-acetyltransferase